MDIDFSCSTSNSLPISYLYITIYLFSCREVCELVTILISYAPFSLSGKRIKKCHHEMNI